MILPETYINNMKELIPDDYEDYLKCLDEESHKGLRVNTLKISCDEFEKRCPFKIEKIPFIDNGYYFFDDAIPSKHPYYHGGLYYIQEPSAMLPANRLPIMEGDKVLDLCAAPGGKATELASKLKNTGVLYANDISASRAKALLKNLEMAGTSNIYVTAESPENLAVKLKGYFNKILVDAPCSGEGMFRKDNSLISAWMERGPEYYSGIQKEILESAYDMLSEGGMILYSTCTFSKIEDEDNISYLLNKYNDLSLVSIEPYEGFTEGFELKNCVRVFPHKMKGEGHFLALLKKDGCYEREPVASSQEFIDINGLKYILPALKDNGFRKGLRYLRTGLYCGEEVKGKFKYSQSYAMSLKIDEFDNVLSLNIDDIRVIKYLKGETIFSDDTSLKKGYVLVAVDKYPLGFAVNDGRGSLKNMINVGWRIG